MATTTRIDELLRCFPFLAEQPEDLLQRLSAQATFESFQQGQPICRVDQPPARIYFLLEGQARSVVFSRRLARGVATLQRLDAGTVLGWTLVGCGRCWETLIASTDLVVVALPHSALQQEMDLHPALAERVRRSVSPTELFGVLDAHLQDYPRDIAQEVLEAATQLADGCVALSWTPPQPGGFEPNGERLWLVAAGELPLGSSFGNEASHQQQGPIRLLGIDRQRLAAILEPPATPEAETNGNGWHGRLLASWQQQRATLEPSAIGAAAPIDLRMAIEPTDQKGQAPEDFPWVKGVGPLESPVSAFLMLSQHLDLPFRRELLRRVFTDQVKRHGEASLALAGAVAESMGLQTQLLEIQAEGLPRLSAPFMVRWGNGMALVYRATAKSLVLGIPASGNQDVSMADFRDQWGTQGDVLTLRVNELTPRRKFGFSWFLPALRQHRTVLVEVLVASFFVQLFGLVSIRC